LTTRRLVSLWAPVAAYAVLIFILSEQEGTLRGLERLGDKFLHLVGYCVLGVLSLRAFHGNLKRLRWKPSLLALIFTIAYGISDEYHQFFVAGRKASVWDAVANAMGACLAVGLVTLLRSRKDRSGPGGPNPASGEGGGSAQSIIRRHGHRRDTEQEG